MTRPSAFRSSGPRSAYRLNVTKVIDMADLHLFAFISNAIQIVPQQERVHIHVGNVCIEKH